MNSIYKKIMLLSLPALMLMACKEQLNVFPTDKQVDGNVIVDAKSAATVLNGVYYRFANSGTDNNDVPSTKWIWMSEVIPSELSGLISNQNPEGLDNFTFNPTSYPVADKWQYGYNLVNAANGFLKNMETVTTIAEQTKRQMQAEGRFLRAFANAELLWYFGQYRDMNSKYGIILRDHFVNTGNISQPRAAVKDVYDAILADLNVAIAGLPALNTKLSYANVWVARLLKARVLMNRGGAGDYAAVISLTDDIMKNSPFQLEGLTKDIFLTKGFQSKEVMMTVQPFPAENYKFQQYQYYNQYVGTPALASLMQNDPRAAWTFQPIVKRGATINAFTKYYSGSSTAVSFTSLSVNGYPFRLTEAWLLQAEAITLSGGDLNKARNLLKEVMTHAGITDFTAVDAASTATDLQLLIVKETMKNFVGENGADWLALRRLPIATLQSMRPALKSVNQLTLPIPRSEFTNNSQVEQNPGF